MQASKTLEARLFDGDQAKTVLENEAFSAAFAAIEEDLISKWTQSPARDAQGRESIWTYLMMLRRVREQLVTTLETGRLAKLELQHRQSLADRAKNYRGRLFG